RLMSQTLQVLPECRHLIEEAFQYRYQPDGHGPIQKNDHALDALRYLIMGLGDITALSPRGPVAPPADDRHARYKHNKLDMIWGN
ncbi:MAG: hypothetical protein ACP5O1_05105, partial [Phycisphaerae bacterium]